MRQRESMQEIARYVFLLERDGYQSILPWCRFSAAHILFLHFLFPLETSSGIPNQLPLIIYTHEVRLWLHLSEIHSTQNIQTMQ